MESSTSKLRGETDLEIKLPNISHPNPMAEIVSGAGSAPNKLVIHLHIW
jgi:hypothetical protein